MASPFDRYNDAGRRLLGRPRWGNGSSRRGYGIVVFEQCGPACVYCGFEMGDSYEAWLNLSVDHVVPAGDGRRLGYPAKWIEDVTNLVTSCRACNEFLNGYRVTDPPPPTLEAFFDLRDLHFDCKREWVRARHATERAWYDRTRSATHAPATSPVE